MRHPWVVVLAVVGMGCQPIAPRSMRDIRFPAGFQIDTQRKVAVIVKAPAGVDTSVPLTIRTGDGQMLFEGPGSFAVKYGLKLRVPAGTTALEFVEGSGSGARSTIVALQAGEGATYTLGA